MAPADRQRGTSDKPKRITNDTEAVCSTRNNTSRSKSCYSVDTLDDKSSAPCCRRLAPTVQSSIIGQRSETLAPVLCLAKDTRLVMFKLVHDDCGQLAHPGSQTPLVRIN